MRVKDNDAVSLRGIVQGHVLHQAALARPGQANDMVVLCAKLPGDANRLFLVGIGTRPHRRTAREMLLGWQCFELPNNAFGEIEDFGRGN